MSVVFVTKLSIDTILFERIILMNSKYKINLLPVFCHGICGFHEMTYDAGNNFLWRYSL